MDHKGLCPRAWFEAAWPLLESVSENSIYGPEAWACRAKRLTIK
jgi:hypothetical protein